MKERTLQTKKSKKKYTLKIKKTTKHPIQILSCRENKSLTCANNNYNEWSRELKQHNMQLKHKKCKCKCFPQGI